MGNIQLCKVRATCSLRLELLEDRLPPGDVLSLLHTLLNTQTSSAVQTTPPASALQSTAQLANQATTSTKDSRLNVAPASLSNPSFPSNPSSPSSPSNENLLPSLELTRFVEDWWHQPRSQQEVDLALGDQLSSNSDKAIVASAERGAQSSTSEMTTLTPGQAPLLSSFEEQTRSLTLLAQQLPLANLSSARSGQLPQAQPLVSTAPPTPRSTSPDGPSFAVASTYPLPNGAAEVPSTSIYVAFNAPVDPASLSSLTFSVFGRTSGMANGSFSVSEDGLLVAFTPSQPFLTGEVVEVRLNNAVAAQSGQPLRTAGYAWTFWVQAGTASANFAEASRLDTGTNVRTYGGATTDLNGDRLVDIAVVNEVSADMRVFLNAGAGSFSPFTTYRIRSGASPTAVGDFNRDGYTDIATSNFDDNSMSVLLGNGDGTFQVSQTYAAGRVPAGIAAVDITGDGAAELILVNSDSNNLSYFQNNGDGTFQPQFQFFSVPGAGLYGLSAADMNNDGVMDLVVGARNTRQVFILLFDGEGSWVETSVQNSGGDPWVLRTADVNGDYNADVVIANNSAGNMAVLLGTGTGSLLSPVTYGAGTRPVSVSPGDLNGDGYLDMVISNFQSSNYYVFLNNGNGEFTRSQILSARRSGSCALVFDYDGDGRLDVGGVDEIEDEIILFRNS